MRLLYEYSSEYSCLESVAAMLCACRMFFLLGREGRGGEGVGGLVGVYVLKRYGLSCWWFWFGIGRVMEWLYGKGLRIKSLRFRSLLWLWGEAMWYHNIVDLWYHRTG